MLYDDQFLVFGNKNDSLYDYKGPTPDVNLKDTPPEKFKEMSDLLAGLFETSKYMIHHNPKLKSR